MSEVMSLQNHSNAQKACAAYLDTMAESLRKMDADFDEYTDYLCEKLLHKFRLSPKAIGTTEQNPFASDLTDAQKQLGRIQVHL